jgi:hypothetical protein
LIPLAVICAALALVLAGCGGDDDTSTTSTTSVDSEATGTSGAALTETEFLAQGNAICLAGNQELEQAANDAFAGGQPTDAQIEQFAAVLVPNVQGQVDAIRTLTPPAELADEVETFLSDAEDALAQVADDPSLLAANDDGPFVTVNQQARQIGLDECGG